MSISSIGSSSYYTGQMSQMWRRSGNTGMSASGVQGNRPPDPAEAFSKVDSDGSGGLDQTEFQTLADKISEATGQEVDAEELFNTYDEDGDGILSESETQAVMEDNRPEGPPPGGMMGPMPGGPPDTTQIFSEADEDEDGYLNESEAETLAEMIGNATDEEVDVSELLAEYDEDGDGLLSQDETDAALAANRPDGPPPPPPPNGMGRESFQSASLASTAIEGYMKASTIAMSQNQGLNSWAMFNGNGFNDSSSIFSVNLNA